MRRAPAVKRTDVRRRLEVTGLLWLIPIVLVVVLAVPGVAQANWLSKLVREAGEAGGTGGAKLGLGALDNAALHIRTLPKDTPEQLVLAAHATPEGHWRFVNRSGEVYTAGNADEIERVAAALAPDIAAVKPRLAIYLSEASVFDGRAALSSLPADSRLHMVAGRASYSLVKKAHAGGERLFAEVRPNVALALDERVAVGEALFQLARPLESSRMRVLSLMPGGPDSLKSVPRYDPETKSALVDEIDPLSLPRAVGVLRGQTAVITGRVEGGQLRFKPASGSEGTVALADLERAAAAADVNLVVLSSSLASQPGGRNWLWQRVSVDGLDDALRRATFADFLDALGARRGPLLVYAQTGSEGRAVLKAAPAADEAPAPLSSALGEFMSDVVGHATGSMMTAAIDLSARSEERQRELDARLLPGIPSLIQISYLVSLFAGIAGLAYSRDWWRRLWPAESRSEYRGPAGYWAARAVRLLAFVLVFLPVVGVPALLAVIATQVLAILNAPVRLWRWLGRVLNGRGTPA